MPVAVIHQPDGVRLMMGDGCLVVGGGTWWFITEGIGAVVGNLLIAGVDCWVVAYWWVVNK